MNKTETFWARIAVIASVSVATILIAIKLVAWQMTGSVAVLGSLADSGLDFVASIVAFFGVRLAAEPADSDHRFGHHKAESIASLVQIMIMIVSIVFILWESIGRLITPIALERSSVALMVMVISLILTLGLVGLQTVAIKRSGSLVVAGDKAHYIGDVIANIGAIAAIFLSVQFGILRADAVAGLIAALFLAKASLQMMQKALPQLMDQELSDKDRTRIIEIVKADKGALGLHALRTRRAGRRRFIQFHLELPPDMPLKETHVIAHRIEDKLFAAFKNADIIIHQDPHGQVEPHDAYGVKVTTR